MLEFSLFLNFKCEKKVNNLVLGVIEAFFGEAWSWEARSDYAKFLKDIQ